MAAPRIHVKFPEQTSASCRCALQSGRTAIVESFGRLLAYESPRRTNPRSKCVGYGDLRFSRNMVVLDWHRMVFPGFGFFLDIPRPSHEPWVNAGRFMVQCVKLAVADKVDGRMSARNGVVRCRTARTLGGCRPCRVTIPISRLILELVAALWVECCAPGFR